MQMISEWIILCLLLLVPLYAAFNGRRKKAVQVKNKFHYYFRYIFVCFGLLGIFYVLNPALYSPLNFAGFDKGVDIGDQIFIVVIVIFTTPLLLSLTPWNNYYPKDISTAKELFGYPVPLLPDTGREYLMFVCYIVVGVIFEELICRQFMFYSLNKTLHLNGDLLIVISSLLFAVGHLYQGWKGVLSNFLLGLVLGKIFLFYESLAYPIALHMALNLTITVLAFRRIRDLKRKATDSKTLEE